MSTHRSHVNEQSLVAVEMTVDAAEQFYSALLWATAVADVRADEWKAKGNEERTRMFREHGVWLRWGASRVANAAPEEAER